MIIMIVALFVLLPNDLMAAKKTKWQGLLEKNGVPTIFWEKCLPKVSRQEYRKVISDFLGSQSIQAGQSGTENDDNSGDIKIVSGKYPLPDTSGKIAREQHLWLKSGQSASSHYKITDTPSSCQNGMAGGYGSFGSLDKGDKEEEIYYVNMRWGYVDWIEPESDLDAKLSGKDKSLTLDSADEFARSGYVKIGDEYIRYSSKQGDKLKGLKRGYKGSASSHEKGDSAKEMYKYKGGKWERITRTINANNSKKDWYKKQKVLVTNKRNEKQVVTSILEAGPAIWTGRVGGLSPEAFSAINAATNEECTFQYVDDGTKLGPVK